MIDTKAAANRVVSWMSYKYNVSGELYWGVNAADGIYTGGGDGGVTSWGEQWLFGGNGEGSLTYPGRVGVIGGEHFIPVASMRLKLIRDGLEDR